MSFKIPPLSQNALISRVLCFFPGSATPAVSKSWKARLDPLIKESWTRLKKLSGSLLGKFIEEIEAGIAGKKSEHAPNYYKLFLELHKKTVQCKAYNPAEFFAIQRAFKFSLSENRFLQIEQMVEAALDCRAVWDRIEPEVAKISAHGVIRDDRFYSRVDLWFKSKSNNLCMVCFRSLNLYGLNLSRVPQVLSKFTQIVALYLGKNSLKTFPIDSVANLSALEFIDLRANQLSPLEQLRIKTELPERLPGVAICLMDHDSYRSARAYNLTRVAPVIFKTLQLPALTSDLTLIWFQSDKNSCELEKITTLDLSSWGLTEIPEELYRCKNLTEVDLRGNPGLTPVRLIAKTLVDKFPKLRRCFMDGYTFNLVLPHPPSKSAATIPDPIPETEERIPLTRLPSVGLPSSLSSQDDSKNCAIL